ncbi:MAG: ATP-binding protein [Bacteroidetes bacterium]|nr:ATP-binding protein [Bacteroidota bacterium]
MINRKLESEIVSKFQKGKGIIILGPRQVGKTTLIKKIINENSYSSLWLNGDEPDIRQRLTNITSTQLKNWVQSNQVLVIDEAQRIENIGLTLKIAIENLPEVQVVISGSSSLDLANKINEPLTGRKFEYFLYPISYEEMNEHHGEINEKRSLENRLIFGSYPEIINNQENPKDYLNLITESYLYKDLLMYEGVNKPAVLTKILQALALQIGSEVSYTEVAQLVGVDKNTVEKYIDLLEKSFVVFKLNALSRNVRNEIKKTKKIYFYDTGVRNALIGNFQNFQLRTDKGALWENYLMAERLKFRKYNKMYGFTYFWRTFQQQEIDYIEEYDGHLYAFEYKWNPAEKVKLSETFTKAYPNSSLKVINPDNYESFLLKTE